MYIYINSRRLLFLTELRGERYMDFLVRLAIFDDLDFVSQDGYTSRKNILRKVEQEEVFIVEKNSDPIGYLRLEFLWSTEPYIGLIRVLEPHRNQGAGSAMLAHVEDVLRNSGHSVLYSSSQANEPPPQSWHRHMGFQECGIISGLNEGGVGEIFFRKTL
jgi:ribosomal protein S18 acetylase RimI-like enzyme